MELNRTCNISLLTVKDVATMLKVKPSTVYGWAEQDRIPYLKINGALRFKADEISKWLATCQKGSHNNGTGKRPEKGGLN